MIGADVNGSAVSVAEAGDLLGEIGAMPGLTEKGKAKAREWVADNIATVDAVPDLEDITYTVRRFLNSLTKERDV